MGFKIDDTATISKTITEADIEQFSQLTGDTNPVHLDGGAAKKTRFGKRIAHGMWGVSLIGAVLGTKLPGPGTIYLKQTAVFKAPVFIGDTITANVKVTNVREEKNIYTLQTVCVNQHGETILDGEAVVLFEKLQ